MTQCECGAEPYRVIYMGFPMWLCSDDECNQVWGFWSRMADLLPIASEDDYGQPAFAFMPYDGWYLPALWMWLFGANDDAD